MTVASLKRLETQGYQALTPETVSDYVSGIKDLAQRLGGKSSEWHVREVGDGNLNLVFIIKGAAASLCVKQALPYVRLVGESWPLPLSRAHFEYAALQEEFAVAPQYVPAIYHHDAPMALTVMECLSPHIILRKGLIQGIRYHDMAKHLGEFLAKTLHATSDFALPAAQKKMKVAYFAANTAMCKISEDLIFDEPYFDAPMNRHTPALDDIAKAFQIDSPLKCAVQDMKWRFLNNAEAMLHGDLHTGSVMVTETDTRAIDPEFAFFGPMGFDVGAVIGNFLLAYFAQAGHASAADSRKDYANWVLQQIPTLWQHFADTFRHLCLTRGGDVYDERILSKDDLKAVVDQRLAAIWQDTLGFAACKMIRRILGLAHVEDLESIKDEKTRAQCERRALTFARAILLEPADFSQPELLAKAATHI
jgi:5-methylthioribose kinase